jgi:endonuclease YncB( thermonuclease family)
MVPDACRRAQLQTCSLRYRVSQLLTVAALAVLGAGPGQAADNRAGQTVPSLKSEPAPASSPVIAEWLNQAVRLRGSTDALDRPSSDGQAAGRIRGGAEVKAIGIVAGREWVQIELPDRRLAYIPIGAIELNDNPAAARAQGPQPAATTTPAATSQETISAPEIVRGPVISVPNAATLVLADQRVRLSGIDPGPSTALAPFENWLRAQGVLQCEPDAQTGRYHCFTGGGVDVAEAAILNGAGRVGDGATPAYRESETEARRAKRGFWAEP